MMRQIRVLNPHGPKPKIHFDTEHLNTKNEKQFKINLQWWWTRPIYNNKKQGNVYLLCKLRFYEISHFFDGVNSASTNLDLLLAAGTYFNPRVDRVRQSQAVFQHTKLLHHSRNNIVRKYCDRTNVVEFSMSFALESTPNISNKDLRPLV